MATIKTIEIPPEKYNDMTDNNNSLSSVTGAKQTCETPCLWFLSSAVSNIDPQLGVIREQGEWPLTPKGARSMA